MTISPATTTAPRDGESAEPVTRLPDLTRFTFFRGRVALAAILRALGVSAGEEVLLQAFTCVAVPEGIMSIGARPRYVDIEAGGLNMDATDLLAKINDSTKAIVVQHSFGVPADIVRIAAIARERGIPLIEDCAHTITSTVEGQLVGSFGDAAFYSYEAAKPVFVGIGGSAVSNDARLTETLADNYGDYEEPPRLAQIETATLFHAHRVAYRPSTYWTVRSLFRTLTAAGIIRGNYNKVASSSRPATDFRRRMGTVQRNVLQRELRKLAAQTAHRRYVASAYRQRIRTGRVTHVRIPLSADPAFGRYPMFAEDRAALVEQARDAKVELAVFYDTAVQPLRGEALRAIGYEPGSCANAEWAAERIISLPTSDRVDEVQIRRAVDFLNGRAIVADT